MYQSLKMSPGASGGIGLPSSLRGFANNPTYNMQTGQFSGTTWGGGMGQPGGMGQTGGMSPGGTGGWPTGPGGMFTAAPARMNLPAGLSPTMPPANNIFRPQSVNQPSPWGAGGGGTYSNPMGGYRPGQWSGAGQMQPNGQFKQVGNLPFGGAPTGHDPTPGVPGGSPGGPLQIDPNAPAKPMMTAGSSGNPQPGLPQNISAQNTGGYDSSQFASGNSMFSGAGPVNGFNQWMAAGQPQRDWSQTMLPGQNRTYGIKSQNNNQIGQAPWQMGMTGTPGQSPAPGTAPLDQRSAAMQAPSLQNPALLPKGPAQGTGLPWSAVNPTGYRV